MLGTSLLFDPWPAYALLLGVMSLAPALAVYVAARLLGLSVLRAVVVSGTAAVSVWTFAGLMMMPLYPLWILTLPIAWVLVLGCLIAWLSKDKRARERGELAEE